MGKLYAPSTVPDAQAHVMVFFSDTDTPPWTQYTDTAPWTNFILYIDGHAFGLLEPDGYLEDDIAPGDHTVAIRWTPGNNIKWQKALAITAKAGETFFYEAQCSAKAGPGSDPILLTRNLSGPPEAISKKLRQSLRVNDDTSNSYRDTFKPYTGRDVALVDFKRRDESILDCLNIVVFVDGQMAGTFGPEDGWRLSLSLSPGAHDIVARYNALYTQNPAAYDLFGPAENVPYLGFRQVDVPIVCKPSDRLTLVMTQQLFADDSKAIVLIFEAKTAK